MKRRTQRFTWIVLAVLLVSLTLHFAIPALAKNAINKTLASLDGYDGSVRDVDVSLLSASVLVHDLSVMKASEFIETPFIYIPTLHVRWDWRAARRGELAADIDLQKPALSFIDGEGAAKSQVGLGPDWVDRLSTLVPFTINRFSVSNGVLRLLKNRDGQAADPIAEITDVSIEARNFSNIADQQKRLPAEVRIRGSVEGKSDLEAKVALDPLSNPLLLAADARIVALPLRSLNPLLREYANVDAQGGTFEAYMEIATEDGRFQGYVKPLFKDAEFFSMEEDGSLLNKAWQAVVDTVNSALENDETSRSGARVPLSGELNAVDAELIPAIFSIFRNAFIEALVVGIQGSAGFNKGELTADEAPRDGR